MAAQPREYQRLPGRGPRRQGMVAAVHVMSRLWLGADHLLGVDSTGGYCEDYKRFYYRDIQAISVRRTDRGKYWNLTFGILAGVPALIASGVSDPAWRTFWLVLAMVFGLLLLGNALSGPTCVCHIRTAVQLEELPSLRRWRNARRTLARLRPLIAQAQGEVAAPGGTGADVPGPTVVGPAAVIPPSDLPDPGHLTPGRRSEAPDSGGAVA